MSAIISIWLDPLHPSSAITIKHIKCHSHFVNILYEYKHKSFEEGSWLIFIECVEWQFPKFSHSNLNVYKNSFIPGVTADLSISMQAEIVFDEGVLVCGVISWGKYHKESENVKTFVKSNAHTTKYFYYFSKFIVIFLCLPIIVKVASVKKINLLFNGVYFIMQQNNGKYNTIYSAIR